MNPRNESQISNGVRHLGIDYGEKRVGIALSDKSGLIASPLETIPNDDMLVQRIMQYVHEHEAGAIVIGEPRAPAGEENPIHEYVRALAEQLRTATHLPVHFMTEQFSSVEAARYADGKPKDDASAAAVILQRFLDMDSTRETRK